LVTLRTLLLSWESIYSVAVLLSSACMAVCILKVRPKSIAPLALHSSSHHH
jgi:hypothetical protein